MILCLNILTILKGLFLITSPWKMWQECERLSIKRQGVKKSFHFEKYYMKCFPKFEQYVQTRLWPLLFVGHCVKSRQNQQKLSIRTIIFFFLNGTPTKHLTITLFIRKYVGRERKRENVCVSLTFPSFGVFLAGSCAADSKLISF